MKMRVVAVALLALPLAAGCGDIEPGRTGTEAEVIGGLGTIVVSPSPFAQAQAYVGTVESPDRGVLAARIDARVKRLAVVEGERVEAGQLLAVLDETQVEDRRLEAQAALAGARARQAAAQAQLGLAEKTFDRYRQLYRAEALTPQEFDRQSAELQLARQQLASAVAGVEQAEAVLNAAQTAAGFSRVTAPYAATVARITVEQGSTVLPGTPVLSLDRRGAWRVRADLPEALSAKVTRGERLVVEVPALNRSFAATLSEILPTADPRSRTFQVTLELPEAEGLSAGMFARVRFEGQEVEALLVPAGAVVTRGQLTAVYVVRDKTVHYRMVRTGRQLGKEIEILSGLSAGETLVVEGMARAKNGARVEH